MRLLLLLIFIVPSLGVAELVADQPVAPSSAAKPAVDLPTLVDMVRQRPFTFSERRPIIGASFSGDTFRLSTLRPGPLEPDPLVTYFADWRFAARLQLLFDYASWQLSLEQPRRYGGPLAERERQRDHEADLRIATLVREAGYEKPWRPFVAVYAQLRQKVTDKALKYRRDTGDDNPVQMMAAIDIDTLARSALEGVIDDYPVNPEIVAQEMVWLLETTRGMLGVSDPRADNNLFHPCGSGKDAKIVPNPSHPSAAAFFAAYQADSSDAAANKIKSLYREIVNSYRSWSSEHPETPLKAQLDRIRESEKMFQLLDQIKTYRSVKPLTTGGTQQ